MPVPDPLTRRGSDRPGVDPRTLEVGAHGAERLDDVPDGHRRGLVDQEAVHAGDVGRGRSFQQCQAVGCRKYLTVWLRPSAMLAAW